MRFFPAVALLAALLALAACADDPLPPPLAVYEDGRAEVLGRTDSGRALRIEHEPLDSVMTEPMVMELGLADPDAAPALSEGDKIRFDLVLEEETYRLADVEPLPASTQLTLSTDTTSEGQ
ncbi:MAG: hypothetical protein BRD46_02055 [Bacteroidetes bacterium QS_8_68_15]|nr:MAG: hypothetical protein BRD46_02055 [Bacteroidetes bacterium QS_8_68_15]